MFKATIYFDIKHIAKQALLSFSFLVFVTVLGLRSLKYKKTS